VRLKFQKQRVLKFVSRTIPHSGGYNIPQLAAKLFPTFTLGFIPVIFAAKKHFYLILLFLHGLNNKKLGSVCQGNFSRKIKGE